MLTLGVLVLFAIFIAYLIDGKAEPKEVFAVMGVGMVVVAILAAVFG